MERFIDPNEIAERLIFAVEAVLVLFFVISPIVGYIIARTIANRVNRLIVWCVMFLLVNVCANGGYAYFRERIPYERMPDISLIALMIVGAICIAMLVGKYLAWYLAPSGQSELEREFEEMTPEEMSPMDVRRKAEIERKRKQRG